MGKERINPLFEDAGVGDRPFIKLFKEAVAALKTIALEHRKQTKLLEKVADEVANISTDIEEIKTSL